MWWVRRVSHVMRYMAKFAPDVITLEEAEKFGEPVDGREGWQPAFRK